MAFQCSAVVSSQELLGLIRSPSVVEPPELVNEAPSHGDECIVGRRREECGGRPEGDNGACACSGDAKPRLAPGGADASEAEGNHREAVTYSLRNLILLNDATAPFVIANV